MSTGGFGQAAWSPCIYRQYFLCRTSSHINHNVCIKTQLMFSLQLNLGNNLMCHAHSSWLSCAFHSQVYDSWIMNWLKSWITDFSKVSQSLLQGDTSCWFKPPVDIKTKVPFWPGQVWINEMCHPARREVILNCPCSYWQFSTCVTVSIKFNILVRTWNQPVSPTLGHIFACRQRRERRSRMTQAPASSSADPDWSFHGRSWKCTRVSIV